MMRKNFKFQWDSNLPISLNDLWFCVLWNKWFMTLELCKYFLLLPLLFALHFGLWTTLITFCLWPEVRVNQYSCFHLEIPSCDSITYWKYFTIFIKIWKLTTHKCVSLTLDFYSVKIDLYFLSLSLFITTSLK